MIALGVKGAAGSASSAELSRLRARYARGHHVRLRGLLKPELVALVQEKLRRAEFRDFSYLDGLNVRQKPADPALDVFLWMVFGGRRFLDFIEAVTGDGPIVAATGGVFRMLPGGPHRLGWHQDLEDGRRAAAMTVNLSPLPPRGGRLEIRTRPGRRRLALIPYARAGDATLFRVRADLEHRSTPLTGARAKTIYSCWFQRAASPERP